MKILTYLLSIFHSRCIDRTSNAATNEEAQDPDDESTANGRQCGVLISANAQNIAAVADGDWGLIAPFGDHPSPDGSYVQHFDAAQSNKLVKTWNSLSGKAMRLFKNVSHGLGPKFSAPIWDGHPDSDKDRYPVERLLAEATDVRTGNSGLEGKITWNARSADRRTKGPLYPSPLWWHNPPAGTPPTVYPELLESIGLVPTPNISSAPAWTTNSRRTESDTPKEPKMKKLLALLGLADSASEDDALSKVAALQTTANSATSLTTANATLAGEKVTLQGTITSLTNERDGFKTANATLTTERDGLKTANAGLIKGALDLAEKRGIITPAQRADYETKLSTANTAEAAFTELGTKKAEMNVQRVEINGARVDITTANARQEAFNSAVSKLMTSDKLTYNDAFARCLKDPGLAGLVGAMKDPARKEAA